MVHETIQGTFRQTNLANESAEYLAKRDELRLAEIELKRQRERVAELRRHLPPGPALEDYKFIEGPVDLDSGDTPTRTVRLSELFTAAGRPLVVYHLMYGKRQTSHVRCAPHGSTASTESLTTSPRTSTSRLSQQPIPAPCERTPASVAGPGCAS
jgi:predicted dithiol-disulfide oxidoreductase (DUF899 family)